MSPSQKSVDPTLDDIFDLLDQLTQQQETLVRDRLARRHLTRQVRHVVSGTLAKNASDTMGHLFEKLLAGEIDSEIARASNDVVSHVAGRFETVSSIITDVLNNPLNVDKMDPETEIESHYQELQSNLIMIRQAVAQSIATEKQLEAQVQRCKEQAATWANRAQMAMLQNNEDLASQARHREEQYLSAAAGIQSQLDAQKVACSSLRKKLTEFENVVQEAYTKKQLLIARNRAANATARANKIMSKLREKDAFSSDAEHDVDDQVNDNSCSRKPELEQLMASTTEALNAATSVLARMEQFILDREKR